MTIHDFITAYYFHDSLINQIIASDDDKTITISVDFAFWMQDDYQETDPETGIINVVFYDVRKFFCPEGVNFDECSILDVSSDDMNTVTFTMLNDMSDDSFEITVNADSVSVYAETEPQSV